jgi:hypothetical protein
MRSKGRSPNGYPAPAALLALAAAGVVLGGAASLASCITAPPPPLPSTPQLGPKIVHDLVVNPPANAFLTELPAGDTFLVPVQAFDPTKSIAYELFIDFDPGNSSDPSNSFPVLGGTWPPALDGGTTIISFQLDPTRIPNGSDACHTLQFFVADSFNNGIPTPADSLGADSVVWFYTPNGPGSCFQVDAGTGAFPSDAPSDGLLLPDTAGI